MARDVARAVPGGRRIASARDALNALRWKEGALERAIVTYLHRGAPGDERSVGGYQIAAIGHGWLVLRSEGAIPGMIPWHRVLRIEVDGREVWRRPDAGASRAEA